MGWFSWLIPKGHGHGVDELARRLGVSQEELATIAPRYREFTVSKRSGGRRAIQAPSEELKSLQRRILRRMLTRLRAHPCSMGFERGRSIATNARPHVGKAIVVRLDLVDFFPSTQAKRVRRYFRAIGWNRPATEILVRLCTWQGGLPQGAPTSPRLSNLVNYRLDARIAGMAKRWSADYTRYADDITLSFAKDDSLAVHQLRRFVESVVEESGYRVHQRKKAHVRRRHQRQLVTGLVVNERVRLPRDVRRRLRAAKHRASQTWQTRELGVSGPLGTHKKPTLSKSQLEGWRGLEQMIDLQGNG